MKRVLSSFDRIAVYHALNLLESEGIRAIVRNDMLSSAMGELPPAECQAELWVLQDADAPRAESMIREGSRPAGGPRWLCGCGEQSEAQFTHCWKCGAERRS